MSIDDGLKKGPASQTPETDTERAIREARELQAKQDRELAEMQEAQRMLQEEMAKIAAGDAAVAQPDPAPVTPATPETPNREELLKRQAELEGILRKATEDANALRTKKDAARLPAPSPQPPVQPPQQTPEPQADWQAKRAAEKEKRDRDDFERHVANVKIVFETAKKKIADAQTRDQAEQAMGGDVYDNMHPIKINNIFREQYKSIPGSGTELDNLEATYRELETIVSQKFPGDDAEQKGESPLEKKARDVLDRAAKILTKARLILDSGTPESEERAEALCADYWTLTFLDLPLDELRTLGTPRDILETAQRLDRECSKLREEIDLKKSAHGQTQSEAATSATLPIVPPVVPPYVPSVPPPVRSSADYIPGGDAEGPAGPEEPRPSDQELLGRARDLFPHGEVLSIVRMQGQLRIGFSRAARIKDMLEEERRQAPEAGEEAKVADDEAHYAPQCPKCGYVSFSGNRCGNCGYDKSLSLETPKLEPDFQDAKVAAEKAAAEVRKWEKLRADIEAAREVVRANDARIAEITARLGEISRQQERGEEVEPENPAELKEGEEEMLSEDELRRKYDESDFVIENLWSQLGEIDEQIEEQRNRLKNLLKRWGKGREKKAIRVEIDRLRKKSTKINHLISVKQNERSAWGSRGRAQRDKELEAAEAAREEEQARIEGERQAEQARLEREREANRQALEKDKKLNPFKYFLISKMDPSSRWIVAGTENIDESTLEEISRRFGDTGKEIQNWDFNRFSKDWFYTAHFTSTGHTLQLQNPDEVSKEGTINIDDQNAKFSLVDPDWKFIARDLNLRDGRVMLVQKSQEYMDNLLREFEARNK